MQFRIDREKLLSILQTVSKGLSVKTPMPVLTGIHLKATNEELIFTTTNKEISIRSIIENNSDYLTIYETGECVIPGKYFLEIVKKAEGLTIDFSLYEGNIAKIVSERSDFTLTTHDKNNFPETNFELKGSEIELPAKELKQLIKQTSFAAASSESRIILTSVNFTFTKNKLEVTATDSFRLAKKAIETNLDLDETKLNIPSKALDELIKIIGDKQEKVIISFGNNKILFKLEDTYFMTRLVEGVYPNTSSLFPNNYLLSTIFNKSDLLNAADRASLFTSESDLSIVKLRFTTDKRAELSSNSTEIGKVVEEVNLLEMSEIMAFEIAFSSKYLIDALKAIEGELVEINFTGEIKPVVINGKNDKSALQLILPVRVY